MNKIWKVVIVSVGIAAAAAVYMWSGKAAAGNGADGPALTVSGGETQEGAEDGTDVRAAESGLPGPETGFTELQKSELRAVVQEAVSGACTEQLEETVRKSLEACLEQMTENGRLEAAVARYAEVQSGLVNINTAGQEELVKLNGIGEAKAGAILAYREEHGPFTAIEELKNVSGISEGTLEKFRDQVTL